MRIAHRPGHLFLAMSISFVLVASFSFQLLLQTSYASKTPYPPYATVGAYAFYSGTGGSFPFLSGVSGNVSYYVSNVYSNNNSMRVIFNENISLGTEAGTNTTMISQNLTDSIFAPNTFLAVFPANLSSSEIIFQNTDCRFVENTMQTVPAGTFNTTEFQGKNANGTIQDFWFDRSTGLVIEMLETGSYYQLVDSNIAVPVKTQSQIATDLPFILVFVFGWTGAGLLFYAVRRYYIKKGEREDKTNGSPLVRGKRPREKN